MERLEIVKVILSPRPDSNWQPKAYETDIEGNEIVIRRAFSEGKLRGTKTGTERRLGITEAARTILMASNKQAQFGNYLFARNRLGTPYSGKFLNKLWKQSTRDSQISIGLQAAFRHSLGCQLLEEGHSLELVAKALGHSSTAVTRRYAQRTNEAVNQALENRGRVVEFKQKKEGE